MRSFLFKTYLSSCKGGTHTHKKKMACHKFEALYPTISFACPDVCWFGILNHFLFFFSLKVVYPLLKVV